jgi:hypothetical protein
VIERLLQAQDRYTVNETQFRTTFQTVDVPLEPMMLCGKNFYHYSAYNIILSVLTRSFKVRFENKDFSTCNVPYLPSTFKEFKVSKNHSCLSKLQVRSCSSCLAVGKVLTFSNHNFTCRCPKTNEGRFTQKMIPYYQRMNLNRLMKVSKWGIFGRIGRYNLDLPAKLPSSSTKTSQPPARLSMAFPRTSSTYHRSPSPILLTGF